MKEVGPATEEVVKTIIKIVALFAVLGITLWALGFFRLLFYATLLWLPALIIRWFIFWRSVSGKPVTYKVAPLGIAGATWIAGALFSIFMLGRVEVFVHMAAFFSY